MLWIGLTGGIASGKSTAREILEGLGFSVADADKIARETLAPEGLARTPVIQLFGQEILNPQGQIDRAKMAKIVFSDKSQLTKLEQLIHPFVQEEVRRLRQKWQQQGQSLAFYDVPLLFEKNLQSQFDATLVINCSEKLQRERLKTRNKMSDIEIDQRLLNQIPLSKKIHLADYVIQNEGSLEDLKLQLEKLIKSLQKD
jgi:dephospho-CoA kinase